MTEEQYKKNKDRINEVMEVWARIETGSVPDNYHRLQREYRQVVAIISQYPFEETRLLQELYLMDKPWDERVIEVARINKIRRKEVWAILNNNTRRVAKVIW